MFHRVSIRQNGDPSDCRCLPPGYLVTGRNTRHVSLCRSTRKKKADFILIQLQIGNRQQALTRGPAGALPRRLDEFFSRFAPDVPLLFILHFYLFCFISFSFSVCFLHTHTHTRQTTLVNLLQLHIYSFNLLGIQLRG